MLVYGLTGGIACGKSTVAKMLLDKGFPVIDADIVAREVVAPNTIGLQKIVEHFGADVLQADGSLDRKKLGDLVFQDSEARKKLESITHPRIFQNIASQLAEYRKQGHSFAFVEAALMVETGSYRLYEGLIVVGCEEEQQIQRLMQRNDLTKEEAQHRIVSQMPISEKKKMADFYVDNSSSMEHLSLQVHQLIERHFL